MPNISIKLGPTEASKTFRRKTTLESFFQSEQIFWQEFFAERIPAAYPLKISLDNIRNNSLRSFSTITQQIASIEDSLENAEPHRVVIENLYINKQILASTSAYAEWIQNESDPVLSIFLLGAYLTDGFTHILFANGGSPHSQLRSKEQKVLALISEAVSKKVLFENGYSSNIEAEKEALGTLKEEWSELHSDSITAIEAIQEDYSNEKEAIQHCQDQAQRQFDITTKKFSRFMQRSKQNMQKFEDFYEKKLALDSAVLYWADRKQKAYKVVAALAAVIIISAIVGINYLFGISEVIGHNIIDLNTTEAMNGSKETIKYLPILHFAVISTFVIWFLRVMVKILLSKLHSAEVAGEREMFIKSYLALLNEHKESIVDEDDRQLILQSIFRPTSDGYINEDGPKITDILNAFSRAKS